MLNKHPGAQLLKTVGDPPIEIRFGNEQYIQCTAVTPEPNRELAIFTNPDVAPQIRTYYEHRCGRLVPFGDPDLTARLLVLLTSSAIPGRSLRQPRTGLTKHG